MSTPPPPPPPYGSDSSYPVSGPVGGYPAAPPPGYAAYGQPGTGGAFVQQKNAGMAIASLVLSLVGIIPCFWGLQVPGLLGVIFGFVGRNQIKKSNGTKKGMGMAIAGIVIGIILVAIAIPVLIWARNHCSRIGGTTTCNSSN